MVNDFISKLLLIHDGFEQCRDYYQRFLSDDIIRTDAQDEFQRALRKEGNHTESMVRREILMTVESFFHEHPEASAEGREGELLDELRECYIDFHSIDNENLNFPQGWKEGTKNRYFSEFYHRTLDALDGIRDNISNRMYSAVGYYLNRKSKDTTKSVPQT